MATAKENVQLIRRGFEAFNTADVATLSEVIASDCVQHVAGNHRFSGDHKGRDAILGMYGEMAELTGGTMQAVLTDVYATDHSAVALFSGRATRGSRSMDQQYALVFQLVDGMAVDMDEIPLNGEVDDSFWA